MPQALHIFRKDADHLRNEILLLLVLAAALGWAETHFSAAADAAELMVVLAVNYVIARVIHNEVIPGHNQFWITRPYRWQSLLGAKILFILLFVNLPIFVAQSYMIVAESFPFAGSLPGLLWSQLLMLLCVSLPAACLASLTAGLVPFLLAEFILVGSVLISAALHVRAEPSAFLPAMQLAPAAVDWVRNSVVVVVLACLAAFILRWQYKTRRTELGDRYAIGGAVVAAVVFLCLPNSLSLAVQSALSKQTFDAASLNVSLAPVTKSVFAPPLRGHNPNTPGEISLPLAVTGLTGDRELQADALAITLRTASGQSWTSGYLPPIMVEGGPPVIPAEAVIAASLHVDPAFFAAAGAHPVTVSTRLYLTVFGNAQSMTIPIQPEPVNIMDGLQCASGLFNQLHCRAIFRWPRRRVYAKTGEGGVESFIRDVSYSPFPATLGFDPIEQHSFSGAMSATQAIVTTKEPLSHFHIDAQIPGVSLLAYTPEAKRQALRASPPPF